MIDNNNIEELVQQKLQHHESEVSANVWDKIDNSLDQLQPNVDPGVVSDAIVQSAGTNISAWVAGIGATVVGVITVGVFFFNDAGNNVVATGMEKLTPSQEVIKPAEENSIIAEPVISSLKELNVVSSEEISVNTNSGIVAEDNNTNLPVTEKENITVIDENTKSDSELEKMPEQEIQNGLARVEENSENKFAEEVEILSEPTVQISSNDNIEPEITGKNDIIELVEEQEFMNAQASSLGPVPNVFTPNGDGINDHFIFPTENIAELRVSIYNSKGDLIFEVGGTENWYWDGNMRNGQAAAVGNYYYAVYGTGFDKQKHQRKGSLYLNR